MNRFHLSLFVFVLLCTASTRVSGIRLGQPFPSPATRGERVTVPIAQDSRVSRRTAAEKHVFRPNVKAPIAAGTFEAEKRKVPTGPNPLHNKR
ncbi:hypothetical protein DCAR_0418170 [Daucus carota subsp. sativus]|uniref:Uncharacterized protein n=1 Tax=Daucus carota subsp. sativus TaxID=79200 RepID=A0A165Z7E6_DAUCS|nr:hypothetical protein DCAR_0418170 [Daucus carota subsp. sativus]